VLHALSAAADDAFLVPTTVTYQALQREGVAGGMPAELVAKVGEAVSKVQTACSWHALHYISMPCGMHTLCGAV
jgi:predicted GNAT family acetyltransferase